ncbi:hypothetical protein GCM10028807_03560 [Spirosoma daeguense]
MAQSISPFLFGQNAWMPHSYGGVTFYGKLNELWPVVKESRVKLVRIGGNAIETNRPSSVEYLALVDSIRKIGGEPLIQVAYGGGRYTATQAADLVQYINTTHQRNVRYWSIGNEPNLNSTGSPVISVSAVATYIKAFASAMKTKDPSIQIVGPECAWYDDAYYQPLIGGAYDITGRDANNRFYIDIVSFHTYPFSGTQTYGEVVSWPTSSTGFLANVNSLRTLMQEANTKHNRTGANALRWALTEFNVNYANPATNTAEGVGVHGFLNGQFWGQIFGIGMQKEAFAIMPWSVHESSGARTERDLGYLDRPNGTLRRSSFHHLKLLADYARGSYVTSTASQTQVQSVATRDANTVMVAVFSMHPSQSYSTAIQLNTTTATAEPLRIQVNANINRSITRTIAARQTVLYQFSTQGTLLKECRYSLTDYQSGNPPTCTIPAEASCPTAQSGAWNQASTWACGHVPGLGEEAIIKAGHIITIPIAPSGSYTIRKVTYLGGTLRLASGAKLEVEEH